MGRVVGVDQPEPHARARGGHARLDTVARVQRRDPVERVSDEREIDLAVAFLGRLDDERSEEPSPYLLRGDLVRVVPERSDLLGSEAVDVALTRQDCVLRDACDPVLRVRHVDSVPVDRDALLDVLVDERHLDEVPLAHAELRAGRTTVEGQRVDRSARGELDRRVPCRESEAGVGLTVRGPRRLATLTEPTCCAWETSVPLPKSTVP